MSGISIEVAGACAYAIVLFGAALGLDWMAKHSNRRSGRYRTAGFEFKPEHDLWICPEGEELKRHSHDAHQRLVRYRASPQTCNACPAKDGCTDSNEGRELVQPLDSWPHSEAGKFHRGISVVLLALGVLVIAIAAVRNHEPAELLALGLALIPIAIALPRMLSSVLATPSGFPASPAGLQ
jgi:hypothetical protein